MVRVIHPKLILTLSGRLSKVGLVAVRRKFELQCGQII